MKRARFLQSAVGAAPLILPFTGLSPFDARSTPRDVEAAAPPGTASAVFNVCDPSYGAVGDGTAYDDAAIAACFAAGQSVCPHGAVYLFPPGKTFRVRRSVKPPPGAVLFAFGATIKRMDQVSSPFTGSVVGGITSVITGVASTAGFHPGDQVTLFKRSTIDPNYYTIAPGGVGANSITLTSVVRGTMQDGTICSAFPTVSLNYDHQKIYGLRVDGNRHRFSRFEYYSNLVEIESAIHAAVGIEVVSCVIQNAPGEGIVFCATESTCSRNMLTNIRGSGIHLGCEYCTIEGNHLHNCDQHSSRHSPRGAICFSQLNNGLRIVGNTIDTCYNGIAATMSQIHGVGGTGSIIADNQIKGATNQSLYFMGAKDAPTADSMTWRGNKCYGRAPSTWTNQTTANPYPAGARHFELLDNYFEGPVHVIQMNDVTIRGNTVNLAGNATATGLTIESSQNVELAGNEIFGGHTGINMKSDSYLRQPEQHSLVHHNRCLENLAYGITVASDVTGPSIRIADNMLRGTSDSVSISWIGIGMYGLSDAQVSNNVIWSSAGRSIGIDVSGGGTPGGATGCIVTNNHIRGCAVSIVLSRHSSHHIVKYNQLAHPPGGVPIRDDSVKSVVAGNDRLV